MHADTYTRRDDKVIIGSHLRGNIFKDEPWLGTEVLNIKRKVPGNFPLFIIFFNE